jgi:hypothetical protein
MFPHQNPVYTSHLSISATWHAYLIRDLIAQIIFGEEHISLSFSLYSSLHYPVTLSLLGPNILLSLCSSLHVSDQLSYPYKTTGKNDRSVYLDLHMFI